MQKAPRRERASQKRPTGPYSEHHPLGTGCPDGRTAEERGGKEEKQRQIQGHGEYQRQEGDCVKTVKLQKSRIGLQIVTPTSPRMPLRNPNTRVQIIKPKTGVQIITPTSPNDVPTPSDTNCVFLFVTNTAIDGDWRCTAHMVLGNTKSLSYFRGLIVEVKLCGITYETLKL